MTQFCFPELVKASADEIFDFNSRTYLHKILRKIPRIEQMNSADRSTSFVA